MEAAGCIWEMMLCTRWTRDLTGELNPKLQKSLHSKKKNKNPFAVTADNHTGSSSATISKSASSNAPAQKTAFAQNSEGKLKHKFTDAIQVLADYKAAERSCYIHTVNSKSSAKIGTRAGVTARFRERNILTKVDHSTKSTGFKLSPHACRSVPILQVRLIRHQPLPSSTDPQQSQNGLSMLLLAELTHKSFILTSQIFSPALFLRAQKQENQV